MITLFADSKVNALANNPILKYTNVYVDRVTAVDCIRHMTSCLVQISYYVYICRRVT